MPTTSEGWTNWRQASSGVFLPVSAHMPRAIISRTTSSLAALVSTSTDLSDLTAITRPGKGPGIPGVAEGAYRVTTLSFGSPSGAADAPFKVGTNGTAASNRTKSLRSIRAPR